MKKIKVLYDFVLFTIAEKLGFYKNVMDKLSNNPFFQQECKPVSILN
ncbi:MAG: hypothetical protein WCL60_05450 [Methylococcales bacterium]